VRQLGSITRHTWHIVWVPPEVLVIQSLINICSNDYLSLAKHPKIKQAFKQGVDKHASLIFSWIIPAGSEGTVTYQVVADNLNSNKVLFTK
jgi:7-keto-8-aminopelargonate synthetase-like enzyme